MKEKIQYLIQYIQRKKWTLVLVAIGILIPVITVVAVYRPAKTDSGKNMTAAASAQTTSNANALVVGTVGKDDSAILGNTSANNSWPGEIISLENLQIQPDREGTISEWYVRIGEQVQAGQVIGKLSRPPQTPDVIMSLSEKQQMLSEARTSVGALRTYTTTRVAQLQQLTTETGLVTSKNKLTQAILRDSISKVYPIITGQTIIPTLRKNLYPLLGGYFGIKDADLRIDFQDILWTAISESKDPTVIPEKSGLAYFDAVIRLANASYPDDASLSAADIDSLKQMVTEDQKGFISALGETKTMELDRVKMIAELNKDLAMAEGDLQAKEAAYATISQSVTEGYSIIAPTAGTISSVMKKPGEFVAPGMPIATVISNNSKNVLVRMRIPNNIQKPRVGTLLSIVRPSFGTDIQKVQLIGVGNSIDIDGSYMADALFTNPTTWPVGASVRILPSASSSAILINSSSIVWNEKGLPTVWVVSGVGRIFSEKVTIGRTLGTFVEIYTGLQNGDRYIVNPTSDIKENTLFEDTTPAPASSSGDKSMGGMQM